MALPQSNGLPSVLTQAVAVPVVSVRANGAISNVELWLHAMVVLVGMVCVTVLSAFGKINGDECAAIIASLAGISGAVSGVATFQRSKS